MLWGRAEVDSTLDDMVEILSGLGQILMRIDANLDKIVTMLGGADDEEADA